MELQSNKLEGNDDAICAAVTVESAAASVESDISTEPLPRTKMLAMVVTRSMAH